MHSHFGCCWESRGSRIDRPGRRPAPYIFERYRCPIVILRDNEKVHRGSPTTDPGGPVPDWPFRTLHTPDCRHASTPTTSAIIPEGNAHTSENAKVRMPKTALGLKNETAENPPLSRDMRPICGT